MLQFDHADIARFFMDSGDYQLRCDARRFHVTSLIHWQNRITGAV